MGVIETIKEVIADFPEIKMAIVFGSAANKRLTPQSDIDIAVAAAAFPLTIEEKLDLHAALSRALPHEVDLIDLQQVSGPILQQALCKGVLIKKTPLVYAALIKKMWYNQADMMPNIRMILENMLPRFPMAK